MRRPVVPRWPIRSLALAFAVAAALVLAAGHPTHAQDRGTLVQLLRESDDFRVRVQACFALGNTRDPAVAQHLERALSDNNPAVRAAAATALGRLAQRRSLPALQRAVRDPSAAVRMQAERAMRAIDQGPPPPAPSPTTGGPYPTSGAYPVISVIPSESDVAWTRARFAILLGNMENRSGYQGTAMSSLMRTEVMRHLRLVRGARVFERTIDASSQREIQRRRLPRLRLEGNLVRVQREARSNDLSVRCEVSLMLLDDPDRVMRGMLQGAATGTEQRSQSARDQERRLAEQALAGAVRSAMSNADSAFTRAVQR